MERHLLKIMRKDPERGLTLILDQYGNLMNAIALNILKNPQDAEDCISETLLRFWRNYKTVKSEDKLKSYLCTMVRNTAIDMLRTRQKRLEQSLEEELREILAVPDSVTDKLVSREIHRLILSLGDPDATILLRRYWYCESVEEIASEVNLTKSAVQSRLFRAKTRLKEKLIRGGFVDEDK